MNKYSLSKLASETIFVAQVVVKERGESTFFADFLTVIVASDAYGRWLEETTGNRDTIDSVLARALRVIKTSSDSATSRINTKFLNTLTPGLKTMFLTAMRKPWTYSGIMQRSNVIRTAFRRLPSAKLKPMFDIPREYTMVSKAMEASDLDDEKTAFQAISELPIRTPVFKTVIRRFVKRVTGESAYVPVSQAIEAASMENEKLVQAQQNKTSAPIGSKEETKAKEDVIKAENKITEATKDIKGANEPITKAEAINIAVQVANSDKKPKAFEDAERVTGYPPDPEQETAILTEGRVLVAAAAGSGKTSTLSVKVAFLIKDKGADPSSIFVSTFTKNAADEMKKRIKALVGDKADDCAIGTLHSFSLKQLMINGTPKYKEAIKNSQVKGFRYGGLLKWALSEYEENIGRKPDISPKEAELYISKFKTFQIEPDQVDEWISKQKDLEDTDLYQEAAEVYKIYETLKGRNLIFNKPPYYDSGTNTWKKATDRIATGWHGYKRPMIDYDDMQSDFCTYLEKYPQLKEKLQRQFKHFILDEAQDSNNVQLKLFKLLTEKVDASKGENAWIVGDVSQSIYRFRSAKPEDFVALSNDPDWTVRKIKTNYRCKPEIVAAANKLIAHNTMKIDMEAISSRSGNANITLQRGLPEDLANDTLDKIKQQSDIPEIGEKLSSFAVLSRTNSELHDYEAACIVRGIPYKRRGGSNFFNRKEVKKVLAYVTLTTSDNVKEQNEAVLEAYDYPGWYISANFQTELKNDKSGKPYLELLKDHDFLYRLGRDGVGAGKFFNEIMSLQQWAKAEKDNLEKRITTHNLIDEIMKIKGSKGESVADFIKIDVKDEAVEDGEKEERKSYGAIEFLLKMAEPDPTDPSIVPSDPFQFIKKVDKMKERSKQLKDAESGVTLSTIHAAKGLEWKNVSAVMIPPRPDSDLEEERRMAYVQITRAADNLDVLSPTVDRRGHAAGVSQFIMESELNQYGVKKEEKESSIEEYI